MTCLLNRTRASPIPPREKCFPLSSISLKFVHGHLFYGTLSLRQLMLATSLYVHACSRTRARRWAELWTFRSRRKPRKLDGSYHRKLVQNHTVEQSVDFPVPPPKEEIVEVRQTTPQEPVKALASKEKKDGEVAHPEQMEHSQKLVKSRGSLNGAVEQRVGAAAVLVAQETRPLHQTMQRCGTGARPGSGKVCNDVNEETVRSGTCKSNVETIRATNDQNLTSKLNEFIGLTSQTQVSSLQASSLRIAVPP